MYEELSFIYNQQRNDYISIYLILYSTVMFVKIVLMYNRQKAGGLLFLSFALR
jgi:hypothetical protein